MPPQLCSLIKEPRLVSIFKAHITPTHCSMCFLFFILFLFFYLCPFHLPNLGVQSRRVEDQGPHTFLIDKSDFVKELRVGLHHGPWSRTTEDGFFPWSGFMVQLPSFDFLKNQFTKLLGPSLGVNRMGIKRNDHAPKNECGIFFNIC